MPRKNIYQHKHGHGAIMLGLAFLIVAAMMYFGYGWMEIFAVLGILLVLKGGIMMKKR